MWPHPPPLHASVCSGPQGPIPRYPARGRGGYFLVTVNNTQDIICHGTRGHLCKSVDNNDVGVWAHMRPAISVRSLLSNIIHPNMDLISTCLEPPSFQLIKCEENCWRISFSKLIYMEMEQFRFCLIDVDIRLLQSNIVRSVRLFVWFVYFLSYKNSICKVNNISCKNIIL